MPSFLRQQSTLTRLLFIITFVLPVSSGFAQEPRQTPADRANGSEILSIFLDCRRCDETFIRRELTFVNFVRERQLADVHVLVTDQSTGSGGREYQFDLIGQRAFSGERYRLSFSSESSATWDEQRSAFLRTLKTGLVPYLLQTPVAGRIRVDVDEPERQRTADLADRWNGWVFEIYGDGYGDVEATRTSLRFRYGIFADHVTDRWKIRFRPYFNYSLDRFESSGKTVESKSRRDGLDTYLIRSISDHWSLGLFGDLYTSTFSNIDLRVRLSPAVEFSFFPYREASRRELTAAYRVGATHVQYRDTTIFGVASEVLISEALDLNYEVRQPWGAIDVGLEGSHYFHDISKYRIEFDAGLSLRLLRGLSLRMGADVELIHDQLNLPRGDASLEEVLLRQRQLATTYEISGSLGFRYAFGSVYNNVVNTRF